MAGFLLDTNILVQAIRGHRDRKDLLTDLYASGNVLGCSVVTVGEVTAGMRPHEQRATLALLGGLVQYELTSKIASRAGFLKNEWRRRGITLALHDMLIAATALTHELTLVTTNIKDFPMPDIRIHPL